MPKWYIAGWQGMSSVGHLRMGASIYRSWPRSRRDSRSIAARHVSRVSSRDGKGMTEPNNACAAPIASELVKEPSRVVGTGGACITRPGGACPRPTMSDKHHKVPVLHWEQQRAAFADEIRGCIRVR